MGTYMLADIVKNEQQLLTDADFGALAPRMLKKSKLYFIKFKEIDT